MLILDQNKVVNMGVCKYYRIVEHKKKYIWLGRYHIIKMLNIICSMSLLVMVLWSCCRREVVLGGSMYWLEYIGNRYWTWRPSFSILGSIVGALWSSWSSPSWTWSLVASRLGCGGGKMSSFEGRNSTSSNKSKVVWVGCSSVIWMNNFARIRKQ